MNPGENYGLGQVNKGASGHTLIIVIWSQQRRGLHSYVLPQLPERVFNPSRWAGLNVTLEDDNSLLLSCSIVTSFLLYLSLFPTILSQILLVHVTLLLESNQNLPSAQRTNVPLY